MSFCELVAAEKREDEGGQEEEGEQEEEDEKETKNGGNDLLNKLRWAGPCV